MDTTDPSPPTDHAGGAREAWVAETSVRERVEQVLLGLRECSGRSRRRSGHTTWSRRPKPRGTS